MKRLSMMFRDILQLVRQNMVYFLVPILIVLAVLIFVAFYAGPTAFVTFMYDGF